MQKIYNPVTLLVAIIFIAFSTGNATVITCNNNVLAVGQYSNIQTAVNAANLGDTVYVAPSQASYGTVVINKRITLMGGGYNVSGTQFNWISYVDNIKLDSIYASTVSGVRIQGLYVYSGINNNGSGLIHNVTVERCYMNSTLNVLGNGWIIKNNIISSGFNIQYMSNTIISNNIFQSWFQNTNNPSTLITNNVFLYGSYFGNISYATIANNIFFYSNTNTNSGCSYCTFNNNIVYNSTGPMTSIPGTGNVGGGNINNVDPKFTSAPYHNSGYSLSEISSGDWHLLTGSPGKNAGSDGKDIGIYGGQYPPANLQGVPAIPQIQSVNINNAVIPQGGTLNVTIKARKQK